MYFTGKNADVIVDPIVQELAVFMNEDSVNIVPKKPNWDLKSQVSTRIERLKRRTQRAIVELLKEKLASQTDEDNSDEEQ
jgi:coiled-coil domain-containing protein 12